MTTIQDSIIRDISKEVIQEISPDEIPTFDDAFEHVRASGYKITNDHFLGSDLVTIFTPMVIEIVNYVIKNIGNGGTLKNLFSQKKKELTPLTREQLGLVNKLAEKQALGFGLSERKAKQLANAITGSIASKRI